MKLLSLDLGITTGYCIQTGAGGILDMGIIEWSGEIEFRYALKTVIEDHLPTNCIIEKPVILRGPLGDALQAVVNAATGLRLPPCEYVTPSQWKPSAGKIKIPGGTKHLTTHERDAYRMGRWWLQSTQRSD